MNTFNILSDASKNKMICFFKSRGEYDRCDVRRIGRKPHPDWTGRIMFVSLFLILVASDALYRTQRIYFGHGVKPPIHFDEVRQNRHRKTRRSKRKCVNETRRFLFLSSLDFKHDGFTVCRLKS